MNDEPNNKEYALLGLMGLCDYGSYAMIPFIYTLFALEWLWFNIILYPLVQFGKWYVKKKDKGGWINTATTHTKDS